MSRDARKAIPAAAVTLAVFIAAFVLAPTNMRGYDPGIARQVAHSMVTEGTFRVYSDSLGINLPYSSYGIGMSLLMAIAEIVGPLIGRSPQSLDTLINPALLALIALVIWLIALWCGATSRQATLVSLSVALASPLLPYAASTFSEVGTALGVAVGILGILISRDLAYLGGLVAGAGIGIAGLTRPDSFVLVAPVIAIGALVACLHRWRGLAGVATGVLPAIAITGFYNIARFGSPLTTQYQGFKLSDSFPYPFWRGLYGLIASPGRGIIWYAPIVVLMAVGLRWTWQRSPLLTVVCLALMLDRLVFYASWWAWHGGVGWGPRFLVPALPALAPFVLEVVRRLPDPRSVASAAVAGTFACLLVLSLGVQVVGSTTYPGNDAAMAEVVRRTQLVPKARGGFLETATTPAMLAARSDPLLDWSLFPIKQHARQLVHGKNLTSRYLKPRIAIDRLGVAALLFALALAAAWIGGSRKRPDERRS